MVVPLNGAIGPASADFVSRALARAADEHAQLVVLQIDTPGGLDRSMRQIVKDILASPVPVADRSSRRAARVPPAPVPTFCIASTSPPWRRAPISAPRRRSASAHPNRHPASPREARRCAHQRYQGAPRARPATEHVDDDQKAGARRGGVHSLAGASYADATSRWAERAVREAVSLSADEALAEKGDRAHRARRPDLVAKLNGRKVTTASGEHVLAHRDATLISTEPDGGRSSSRSSPIRASR
jgi:membrane-bound serine protease (ClpP class)